MKELTKGVIYTYETKSEKITYKGEHIITSHGSHVFYNIEDNFIYWVKEDSVEVTELKKYPTSPNELPKLKDGWYISSDNISRKFSNHECGIGSNKEHLNTYPTEALVKAAQILPVLIRYRDEWNKIDEFVPDFSEGSTKYAITLFKDNLAVDYFIDYNKLFAFKTKKTGELFLKTFEKELEILKPLLGGK